MGKYKDYIYSNAETQVNNISDDYAKCNITLDVAVDKEKVNKDALVGKLKAWKDSNAPKDDDRSWIAKSGVSVHFKTPIKGDAKNGFVQTDLMFGDPKFMKFALRGAADSEFKGQHRMIMIASVAKAQGYKWSPTNGLVDRITNEPVTKDPNEVAKVLLGDGASADDMRSVETINAKIKTIGVSWGYNKVEMLKKVFIIIL